MEAGFPEELLNVTETVNPASRYKLDALDERFCPLREGDKIQAGPYSLTMISVPGHTPRNAMFWEEKHRFMFTGDHILFDISPNITSWLGVEDSLGDYLDSLKKSKEVPCGFCTPRAQKDGKL